MVISMIFIGPAALAAVDGTSTEKKISSDSPERKDYQFSWATELYAVHATDELSNQKSEVEMAFLLKFDMNINSWMSLNLTPQFIAQNGYLQAPDVVDPQGSRMEIRNASFDLKPSSFFNASIGSLDQAHLHSDIFMSRRSFPAVRVVSRWGSEKSTHTYVFLESAMPTSTAVSNNSADMGATPSLNMAGIGLQLGGAREGYNIKTFVNAYQFAGLSQDLATASVLLGNSGVNTAGSNYQFRYQYQGYEAGIGGRFQLVRSMSLGAFATGIQNSAAITGHNTGWDTGGSVTYDLNRTLQLEPKFDYYHIESDATVAIYNDPFLNTNREGYRSQLKFHYNHKVQLSLSYGQRVPILANPSQPPETWYGLGLETENAKF